MKNVGAHKNANNLINESSPYLLQHAYNPVNWYPWGEEALQKAQKENKLLVISVGYAACHWCHVMEHESFEDTAVAKLMNDHFISIKVDREERPDVDDVYMTAAQLISGRGGWPLNAIALPDGRPVFAGTYYPKKDWMNILNQIVKVQNEDPDRLEKTAEQLTGGISNSNLVEVNTDDINYETDDMNVYMEKAMKLYDKELGGRTGAPKFPMPNAYEFMLKYHWLTNNQEALDITEISLDNMATGGIYDQLGGGFARYSVDKYWLVPHFEKMLYDNAQLVSIYSQAYQVTKKELYKRVIEETLEFVERELTSTEQGFYSSLDADSEGEEGKFYVWTEDEIDSLITDQKAAQAFKSYYDVTKNGNFEHKVILNIVKSAEQAAQESGYGLEEFNNSIEASKQILMESRSKRIRPGLDDKVLTSWNALMIAGYIDAFNALGSKPYLDKALANAEFLVSQQMQKDGRLNRNFKDGKSTINAFLDDYALTAHAFIKLYQATFDKKWLDYSEQLVSYSIAHFYNDKTKMFDYTSDLDPPLIAKKAEYNDNVIPASNSSMARVLHSLGSLNYNTEYLDMSEQMLKNMMNQLRSNDYLSFYSNWMQLLFDQVKSPYEIAIVGEDAMELRNTLSQSYLANSILLGTESDENLALLKDKTQEGITMIYVCQNKVCKLPVSDVTQALELLTP